MTNIDHHIAIYRWQHIDHHIAIYRWQHIDYHIAIDAYDSKQVYWSDSDYDKQYDDHEVTIELDCNFHARLSESRRPLGIMGVNWGSPKVLLYNICVTFEGLQATLTGPPWWITIVLWWLGPSRTDCRAWSLYKIIDGLIELQTVIGIQLRICQLYWVLTEFFSEFQYRHLIR